ncbi:MAG: YceI family protein [Bryobacteraceae bacterium]
MKTFLLAFATLAAGLGPAAEWAIDSAHSTAEFSVRHMMITNVKGTLGPMTGAVVYDAANSAATRIEVSVPAASIDTNNAKRDADLRSADFFDAEKFPTMTFRSTSVKSAVAGRFSITGDLTFHGVTKEVVLEAEGFDSEVKDGQGNVKIGGTATTRINRKDFGLTWNRPLQSGAGMTVGDTVTLTFDLQLRKKE